MRILNITQTYAPFFEFGGPPVKVKALAEGMARRGHEVSVLTADWGLDARRAHSPSDAQPEISAFGRRTRVNGVATIYLPNWAHFRATSWNPALGRYLRAKVTEFDVVHIFGLYDLLGPRVAKESRKRGIPYVVEPIGMFVPLVRSFWLKELYHRVWGHDLLQHAGAIIVTADQERDDVLAGGFPQQKLLLRRNGVEAPSSLPQRGHFRNAQGIPAQSKLILFLGRMSQKKSPDLLLRAFAALPETANTFDAAPHLAFVGPDESGMKARLQQLAIELGVAQRVHISPPLDGLAKWAAYRDSDIFVLPSLNENFGNSAAEAVAAGTPVIVTDQCGVAPLLRGTAAIVVSHDQSELQGAIARLLANDELYRQLQQGCRIALANLDWQEPLDQMEQLYSALAG
jgi:glycosyltransferase involved in cell wall biosynthesis